MKNCIFCKIVNGEIPAKKVYEDDYTIAFLDINPISNGHTLVIPKKHYLNFQDSDENVVASVAITTKKVAEKLLKNCNSIQGFNYLSNSGSIAGQIIEHFHMHVIPKYSKENGFNINFIKDEDSFKINDFIDKIIIN